MKESYLQHRKAQMKKTSVKLQQQELLQIHLNKIYSNSQQRQKLRVKHGLERMLHKNLLRQSSSLIVKQFIERDYPTMDDTPSDKMISLFYKLWGSSLAQIPKTLQRTIMQLA